MTTRRDFLKMGLVPLVPMFPAFTPAPGFTRDMLRDLVDRMEERAIQSEPYLAFIHPSALDAWRKSEARERWRTAWSCYRTARREGLCGWLPPSVVLDRFSDPPVVARLYNGGRGLASGEVGRVEGVRFIESGGIEVSEEKTG